MENDDKDDGKSNHLKFIRVYDIMVNGVILHTYSYRTHFCITNSRSFTLFYIFVFLRCTTPSVPVLIYFDCGIATSFRSHPSYLHFLSRSS